MGPTSGKPLTLVFDNEVVLNGIVKGNIRIFVKKSFTFGGTGNDGDNNLFMIMANNNIFIQRPIKYGFLSSHQNIDLTYKQYLDVYKRQGRSSAAYADDDGTDKIAAESAAGGMDELCQRTGSAV